MPSTLQELLSTQLAPLLPPLRSEVFGPQRFAEHGRSLGGMHVAKQHHWPTTSFFPRLRSNIAMLRQAHAAIAALAVAGDEPGPAALWLLDNFYLIDAQLYAIVEGLPRSYFRQLPALTNEPLAGLPRIYGVAWAYVVHADSAFDETLLIGFVRAYQEVRELGLAEMWALPTVLRVVLVENLRRLAERLATHKAARALANQCADTIEHGQTLALEPPYQRALARGAGSVFLAQLGQRLLGETWAGAALPQDTRSWLNARIPQLALLLSQIGVEQAADNLSVGNAVNALRTIGDTHWPDVVAQCSPLMQRMLGNALFAAEHHTTRDTTLHGIETLARRSGLSEMQVADTLLGKIQSAQADQPAATSAAYWLRGPGRGFLARDLGLGSRWLSWWHGMWPSVALPLYLGAVGAGTFALIVSLPLPALHLPWLALLLLAAPASETVIALLHRLIGESARPQVLPRLALLAGIAPEHRVMVVVPAILSDRATIDSLTHRLLLHYLANPEPNAQFALLADWLDADAARADDDLALLEHARAKVEALNAEYGAAGSRLQRFLLLHRQRSYSASEARWIGWERKRGKLEQLVAELVECTGDSERPSAAFENLSALSCCAPGTRYIVTLDSDTQLPPGRLRELVGVAAHPANRPVLSANGRRVVAGYGILQPRLVTPLPVPKEDTLYHRLFAGQPGIDPYGAASSEVYQDLFGEASFTGKGLLDVQAVSAVLAGHLPEGQVLSHDLLEGALARCGAVTDITLVEDAPFRAEVAASRVHRWTRGDWQLLPILLRSFVQPSHYPLGMLNRWKMIDNLRRSLVAPASLALIVASLLGFIVPPSTAFALVAGAFMAGPLMGALAGFVPSRPHLARWHFFAHAVAELGRAVGGGIWHAALLLQHALLAVDAIARALWRVLVSRRGLLEWTTAAAVQAAAGSGFITALRRHWSVPLVALLTALAVWWLGSAYPILTTATCALWAGAPLWSWAVSRRGKNRQAQKATKTDSSYLHGVARDTWRTFERCVTAADQHLPPDNLQSQPQEMLAHRTSPTNIGLYMLSTACAQEFGWIGIGEMLDRLEATLATLDTLARHKGHFLNWYDTQTGAPLLPMYVSTVDSGNFSGHLLAVAQACLACLDPARDKNPPSPAEIIRLKAVAAHSQRLAWAPDFAFLYHPRRHLLHIGYRVAEQQHDTSFYDLLASESRLTSLIAIAKGDVPVRHWAALGRPFYAVGATAGLRSWSGSMFEYLMPALILVEPDGSVLHGAGVAALQEQRSYAAGFGVPWGISESAYAGCDYTLAYQYAPQGVPRLALRRTPTDELVIAPYATALAAQLNARQASQNFALLQSMGARGRLGFIEALDFTPARQTQGSSFTPVQTVMAHHQGMTIVALANVLLDNVAQRWGMADPHLDAVSSMLHERAPQEVSRLLAPSPSSYGLTQRAPSALLLRTVLPGTHAVEPTQLLSNGRTTLALRANGAGHLRFGALDVHRTRDDLLRDAYGHFLFLRFQADQAPVSLTRHPAPDARAEYRSVFHSDRVVFEAQWPELLARTTVWVSPEDDITFRQVELRYGGATPITVELISHFEVTLADPVADETHPAFSNFFIKAKAHTAQRALRFARTPRLAGEQGLHLAHFLAESAPEVSALTYQVDRQRWLGRNRDAWQPRAAMEDWSAQHLAHEHPLEPALGNEAAPPEEKVLDTGLDPISAIGVRLSLQPGAHVRLTFATAVATGADMLDAVVDKHLQASHIERASQLSATLATVRLRELRMGTDALFGLQTLTTGLLFTLTRPLPTHPTPGLIDKRHLWQFGVSGDRPLIVTTVLAMTDLGFARALSQALAWWSWGGVACDLVVINAEAVSYDMPLHSALTALRDRHLAECAARPEQVASGWVLLRSDAVSPEALHTLRALARVNFRADGRTLAARLQEWVELLEQGASTPPLATRRPLAATMHSADAVKAPEGRFTSADEGGGYCFDVGSALRPLRPWTNVLANAEFGSLVTEAGGGCTWAVNSRMNQLTPWSNDPVADPQGEWLLLQDAHTRRTWSVGPSAAAEPGILYRVWHNPGSTKIAHRSGDLEVDATWCVDAAAAVRQVNIRITNHGSGARLLRLVGVNEWVLGSRRSDRASVVTAMHDQPLGSGRLTALLATQNEASGGFGGGTAFMAWDPGAVDVDGGAADWTCQRNELFDDRGRAVLPDRLGEQQGAGLDPCAALAVWLEVAPGARVERTLLTGWAGSPDAALTLLRDAAAASTSQRRIDAITRWDTLLAATTVTTPNPLFDAMVNRWLLYQTVACRLWARAGFYQAGGATGFRDQLQDAMALSWAAPDMLHQQIVRCAGRQFAAGDVQHWWHAPSGAGVRTHFSDDLLWLPYAVAHHAARSGERAWLDELVPFIEGLTIPEGAEDVYGTPTATAEQATVYEHAARALDHSLRVGVHGLPLMGSGDWNDGMNRVGSGGRGESVWLAWFLCTVVADFAPLARERGETARAQQWELAAAGWRVALRGPAWDGKWYRRAFFDDGQALGSAANAEARIDLVAQAWSVLSDVAAPSRQRMAMEAVQELLVDQDAGLIRLLDPPLVHAEPSAGYIQAYPPGVRENGGQYSHAAVWALMAVLHRARGLADPQPSANLAWTYWKYLSPAHRHTLPQRGMAYGAEPYVMAGDIYSAAPWIGRAGWSWYTGSAAWMHRAAIESMFGLAISASTLSLHPALPDHWPRAELCLRRPGVVMYFLMLRLPPECVMHAAATWSAGSPLRILRVDEVLAWDTLAGEHKFVLPI